MPLCKIYLDLAEWHREQMKKRYWAESLVLDIYCLFVVLAAPKQRRIPELYERKEPIVSTEEITRAWKHNEGDAEKQPPKGGKPPKGKKN